MFQWFWAQQPLSVCVSKSTVVKVYVSFSIMACEWWSSWLITSMFRISLVKILLFTFLSSSTNSPNRVKLPECLYSCLFYWWKHNWSKSAARAQHKSVAVKELFQPSQEIIHSANSFLKAQNGKKASFYMKSHTFGMSDYECTSFSLRNLWESWLTGSLRLTLSSFFFNCTTETKILLPVL